MLRVRSEKGDWRRRRDAHLTLRLGEESFGRVDGYKKESRDPRRGTSAQRALGIFIRASEQVRRAMEKGKV